VTLSLLRFAGAAAATLAALCAAGAWPTSRLAGNEGLVAMGAAAGASFVGALLGFVPVARVAANPTPDARFHAVFLGFGVRLIATVAAVAFLLAAGVVATRAALVSWIVVDYVALLVLETAFAVRDVRRLGGGGSASA
jgi:hypothetical protein